MAFRHSCPNAGTSGSPRCRPNQPGKGPKRCLGCGAAPEVEEGFYGVFRFDPENRLYRADDALSWFQRPLAAQVETDRMNRAQASLTRQGVGPGAHRGYVVRFVRERLV